MAEIMTSEDYDDLVARVSQDAPNAIELEEITARLGAEYHTVWLDGGHVWWAWNEPGESEWHLDKTAAAEAIDTLRSQLDGAGVFDRLADPTLYSQDPERGWVERDEDTMAEYYAIELAALGGEDPRTRDRQILARISAARAEVARLAGLRAHHLFTLQGDGSRGWQARAAETLGISAPTVTGILQAEEKRGAERRAQASEQY